MCARYAVASFDVWQQYMDWCLAARRRRFCWGSSCSAYFVLQRFPAFSSNRLMLQSLDDLFIRLYGSAAMGAFGRCKMTRNHYWPIAGMRFKTACACILMSKPALPLWGQAPVFLAHDIRNLLASLQLNAEQLMELPGEKEQRIGKRLATAIEQSLSLVEWAALYTSDKRDHLDVQRQPLRPIIDDALNFVRLHDPRRRVQLVNDCFGQCGSGGRAHFNVPHSL